MLLFAAFNLALVTEISAAKNCASISKGQECKKAGCKWDFKTGSNWKSCSDIFVEDETDAVEDATDVVVSECSKFEQKRKCERKGCEWTKGGKRFKSCNDPAPRPSTNATAPAAPPTPVLSTQWDTIRGCCRAGGKKVDVLHKESFSGVNATEANAMCANQCVGDLNCTAYEMTKKKKGKKNKSPKFICELHDAEIDSASRKTKSCRAATTKCNIFKPTDSNGCTTACTDIDTCRKRCQSRTQCVIGEFIEGSWTFSITTDESVKDSSGDACSGWCVAECSCHLNDFDVALGKSKCGFQPSD